MSDLCKEFGISRPTGYAILNRFNNEGWDALDCKSHAHSNHPNKTPQHIEDRILDLRNDHKRWGARKLINLMERENLSPIPSEPTVNRILKSHGLIIPRKKLRPKIPNQYPIFITIQPNDIWSADFKGQFRMGNRVYCYPLTIMDSHSSFLIDINGLAHPRTELCKPIFQKAFLEYGLPLQIHTDNGSPFGCIGALRRLTGLSVWFIDYGITPVYSDPAHPWQNSRHERMHRELKADVTRPPGSGFISQQKKFNAFKKEYNIIRPHEGLNMKTPNEVYYSSPRNFTAKVQEWVYNPSMITKVVSVNGTIRWKSLGFVMVSSALSNRSIGLDPLDDGLWMVYYRHLPLGVFNERNLKVHDLEDFGY
jgi:transposase InsO family protein